MDLFSKAFEQFCQGEQRLIGNSQSIKALKQASAPSVVDALAMLTSLPVYTDDNIQGFGLLHVDAQGHLHWYSFSEPATAGAQRSIL